MIRAFVGQYVDYDRFEREEATFDSVEDARRWFEFEAPRTLAEEADGCTRRERGGRVAFVEMREDGEPENVYLYADMPCSAMDDVDDVWSASNDPDHFGSVCVSLRADGKDATAPEWYDRRRDVAEAYAWAYVQGWGAFAHMMVWEYSDEDAAFVWTDPVDGRRMVGE